MTSPNKNPTDTGSNRTGLEASKGDKGKLLEAAQIGVPQPSYDTKALEAARLTFSSQADPVGTVPPPAGFKGVAKTMLMSMKGEKATVFIDLLGERLAFERTGTRLYEALLVKHAAADLGNEGPTRTDLEEIRDEEMEHFQLLVRAIQKCGADPTAETPSADVMGVASSGLMKVVCDARTTFTEALKAVLMAELADNDAWAVLTDLAAKLGETDLATEFQRALEQEEEHLARVRTWLANAIEGQAGVEHGVEGVEPANLT